MNGSYEDMDIGGGYKLLQHLGSGSSGEVWRAEAPGGIEVAVKLIFRPINHDETKRWLKSLELVKRLRHAYLLQTQAYWQYDDRLIIIMELADGSLRDRLKECEQASLPGIPDEELLTYFREAGEALDYLHASGVLHHDVKPDHLLRIGRNAKLLVGGLVKVYEHTQRSTRASGSGTPLYMAPELWRGKTSQHIDQYALAVSYCELRLRRFPFAARDMAEVMIGHLEGRPRLDPLPAAEQKVLLRALAKKPEDRYPSCSSFVEALQNA